MVVINLHLRLIMACPGVHRVYRGSTGDTRGLCSQWLVCQGMSESEVDQPSWACVTREGSLHCPDSVNVTFTLCQETPYLGLAQGTGGRQQSPGCAPW